MRIFWPDGTPDVGEWSLTYSPTRSGPVSQVSSAVDWAVDSVKPQESSKGTRCAVCGNVMHKQFLRRWNGEMTQDYPEGGEYIGKEAR
ncbi:hypothetical protein [Paenibacillus terrae]|uniref:hypothetical protein n=1 Tax=Paenibacillus terrae TaxID=159743 RepID=UPI0010BE3688|nr:hypothetical protein [Paenibacillus terrae]